MVFRLEDSIRQAQNLGPAEAPSRYKSRTTKASALVWASEAPKRVFVEAVYEALPMKKLRVC
jgi:hypothetical protein